MNKTATAQQTQTTDHFLHAKGQGLLQRKCACGSHTPAGGECPSCAKKKIGLQRKLKIGATNDPLEREADRVADQVMAMPLNSDINATPPRIQRFDGQASDGLTTAPDSVDHLLASSGRPLEPTLRQDMESRFGYDFLQVRVHTGGAAEQSARDLNPYAYTAGNNIVFGAGRFNPGMDAGQRLIAEPYPRCQAEQGHSSIPLPQTESVQAGVPPVVHESLQSPGQPLDTATRAFMEPRYGHNFSRVRLHTNGVAAAGARAVGALAYTVGNHIVFDEHALPDRSYARHKVLAHELTHVVQQSGKEPDGKLKINSDPGLENQAEQMAKQVLRGGTFIATPSQASALMMIPLSASQTINPQTMTPDEIRQEIGEIDRYLQHLVLSPDTIDHLNEVRRELVQEQHRRADEAAPAEPATQPQPAHSHTPPFYGLRAAGNAFHGIQMYYTVSSIPHTDRVRHTFNRGPYLIALNEILQTDGSSQIGFYIAYRRGDTLVVGDTGWNEYIIGPDSIEEFLSNLSTYVGAAGTVYMFGPPAPYQAYSGQVTQRMIEGDIGGAFSALGHAWSAAVRDPGWWAQAITATAGALPRGVAPAPAPPPALSAIGGGRPGPIPMRPGPGGRPVVASTPQVTSSGPVARVGGGGGAAAPALEPVVPLARALAPTLVPSPAPVVPAPHMPIGPGVATAVVVAGSTIRGSGSSTTPSTTSRRRRLNAYPICWALQLGPPMLFGVPVEFFVRTPGVERDTEDANQRRLELLYRQRIDPNFQARDWHVHHSVPLFLGGLDAAPGNLTLVERFLHMRGHAVLRYQPQMLSPPPPLVPLPADILAHPTGTLYELVGFKGETSETC